MGFLIRMAFWFSLVLLALPLSVGPDENGHEALTPASRCGASSFELHRIAGTCGRHSKCGEDARDQGRQHTHDQREQESGAIDGGVLRERHARGNQRSQQSHTAVRQGDADRARGERDQR